MMKTSAIFSAHFLHVLIRNTLIFFIVLIVGLFFWLKIGIEIDSVKLSKYHMGGLYIKLDKKLTLKADSLHIPTSKAKPSFNNIPETLENIKYVLTFFDLIELKKIAFNNNTLSVMFHRDYLKVTSKDYEIMQALYIAREKCYKQISPYSILKNIT